MAKLSKSATFFLLAISAFVAHAHIRLGGGGGNGGGGVGVGVGLTDGTLKGASSVLRGAVNGVSSTGELLGGGSGVSDGGAVSGNKLGELLNKGGLGSLLSGGTNKGGDGNVDPATKFKSILNKFLLVLQSYTSKELGPELKNAAIKLIQFVLSYWAQQKPDEMQKFNNFLENSAKATSGALSKASSGGFGSLDVGSSSGGSSSSSGSSDVSATGSIDGDSGVNTDA